MSSIWTSVTVDVFRDLLPLLFHAIPCVRMSCLALPFLIFLAMTRLLNHLQLWCWKQIIELRRRINDTRNEMTTLLYCPWIEEKKDKWFFLFWKLSTAINSFTFHDKLNHQDVWSDYEDWLFSKVIVSLNAKKIRSFTSENTTKFL